MRVVLDTNVVISGLVWGGSPRRLFDFAHQNIIQLYTSAVLLDELEGVISRDKFLQKLISCGLTPGEIMCGYAALARTVTASAIPRTVPTDADDDAVIACSIAAQTDMIVTGDRDLLILRQFQNIAILKPSEAVQIILAAE